MEIRQQIQKGRTFAWWSFIGIALPLLGWILGGLSRSTVKHVEPEDDDDREEVRTVKTIALLGIVFSTVSFLIFSIGGGLIIWNSHLTEGSPVTNSSSVDEHGYPLESRALFMNSCTGGDITSTGACECAYQIFQQNYTYTQFKQLDTTFQNGGNTTYVQHLIEKNCLSL